MAQGDGRSTQEVFADHLREGKEGSVEDDLVRNYAEDVVVLSSRGIHHGHDGIRELAQLLREELPDGTFEYQTTLVDGELAFLEWAGNSERAVVEDGADSFMIRDGRISGRPSITRWRPAPSGTVPPQGRTAMMDASGLQPRALRDVLTGRGRPRQPARIALAALVQGTAISPVRRCAGCGNSITASSDPRQRYCSLRCKQRAKRQRRATKDAMA